MFRRQGTSHVGVSSYSLTLDSSVTDVTSGHSYFYHPVDGESCRDGFRGGNWAPLYLRTKLLLKSSGLFMQLCGCTTSVLTTQDPSLGSWVSSGREQRQTPKGSQNRHQQGLLGGRPLCRVAFLFFYAGK